jgi:hypothetical protein
MIADMTFRFRLLGRIVLLFFIGITVDMYSQKLEFITKLPAKVNESSGIEMASDDSIWTFNDSGGKSELYECDFTGNLLRTLAIDKAKNRDWEDITKDDKGNIYIGDIGNNSNKSKKLRVFEISNPEIKDEETSAKTISFNFEDQKHFPPNKKKMNFDCEGMFWSNNKLYLFTKHRSFPSSTNVYRVSTKKGDHTAKKIGYFFTGTESGNSNDFHEYWITGADISPNGKRVCLINGRKLWVFYNFDEDDFFGGDCVEIDLGKNTQKEAVCFVSNSEVYITDEYWASSNIGGNLYKMNIESYINDSK